MSIQAVKLPVKLPAVPFGILQQTVAGGFGAQFSNALEELNNPVQIAADLVSQADGRGNSATENPYRHNNLPDHIWAFYVDSMNALGIGINNPDFTIEQQVECIVSGNILYRAIYVDQRNSGWTGDVNYGLPIQHPENIDWLEIFRYCFDSAVQSLTPESIAAMQESWRNVLKNPLHELYNAPKDVQDAWIKALTKMYIEYETLSGKVCEYMIKNYDGEKQ